jgi:hypothetical protein
MSDLFGLSDDELDDSIEETPAPSLSNPEEPEDIPIRAKDEEDDEGVGESRDDKKRERPRLMKALEEQRELARKSSEEAAELRGAIQGLQHSSMQARHSGTLQADPIQQHITQTYDAENALRREAQAVYESAASGRSTITDQVRQDFDRRHQEITQRRSELTTMKVMRDNGVRPVDPAEGLQQAIRAQYADVYADKRAEAYVQARWSQYRATGHKDTPELLKHVMTETRAQFKLGGGPAIGTSNAMKQKYQGVAGGGPGRSTGGASNSVRMTPDMKAMAETHYEHRADLNSRQKYELWAKEIGPKFVQAERSR